MAVTAEDFRGWALSLPEAIEQETWGESTFRIRGKIFAMLGPDGTKAGVKATLADQAELVATEPGAYARAQYTGRFGWVSVTLAAADAEQLRLLVIDAWRRTAPKRLAAQLP